MKRLILFIFLLAAWLQNYAQLDFGLKVGYNTSKLSTDVNDIKESFKSGFQVGAFLRVGKKLYLQPEFYYSTTGGKLTLNGTSTETQITLQNLSIPVLLGYKIIKGDVINLRVMTGPSANFIINEKISGGEVFQDPLQGSDFKNIAWGYDVGAGVDVLFLTLDIRYEWGLNDIYNGSTGDQTLKNNIFIVSLGFKIL